VSDYRVSDERAAEVRDRLALLTALRGTIRDLSRQIYEGANDMWRLVEEDAERAGEALSPDRDYRIVTKDGRPHAVDVGPKSTSVKIRWGNV